MDFAVSYLIFLTIMAALRVFVILLLITEALFLMRKAYKVTFVSIGWSENSTLWDISQLKLKGRERLVNGTVDLFEDLDDEHYSFAGDLWNDSQGDGNYKLHAFEIPKEAICKAYKNYWRYFKNFAEFGVTTNFPIHMDDLCPIEKGHYYLKNVSTNTDSWPEVVPHGYSRLNGYFYKDDVLVGSYFVTLLVESH